MENLANAIYLYAEYHRDLGCMVGTDYVKRLYWYGSRRATRLHPSFDKAA